MLKLGVLLFSLFIINFEAMAACHAYWLGASYDSDANICIEEGVSGCKPVVFEYDSVEACKVVNEIQDCVSDRPFLVPNLEHGETIITRAGCAVDLGFDSYATCSNGVIETYTISCPSNS